MPWVYFLLCLELPKESKQQNQLQPCLWDPSVFGLHLWKYNRGPGTLGSLHQREECGAGQPDSGELDWVLSRSMPWKSGNWKQSFMKIIPTSQPKDQVGERAKLCVHLKDLSFTLPDIFSFLTKHTKTELWTSKYYAIF